MADGMFIRGALDFHYSGKPCAEVFASEGLASSDPWIALAATLEQAKRGNFEHIANLKRLVWIDHPASLLTRATLDLIGSAGTVSQLHILEEIMLKEETYLSIEACRAACSAGCLSLIPSILKAWGRGGFQTREAISQRIGELLEEWDGPITTMSSVYGSALDSESDLQDERNAIEMESEYAELVKTATTELRSRCKHDDSPVILGRPFGVVSLAKYMFGLARSDVDPMTLRGMFYFLRHRFDASTGIDCSTFFDGQQFRPLAAAAILEAFLESPETRRYEEGTRYFFGHRIPG